MMSKKFTPGLWMVASDGNVVSERNGIVERIAVSIFCSKERREANARLIAAAPQMLEALEELVELKDHRHSLPVEIYQESREKAWNKCRAAIAAAKESANEKPNS